MAARIPKIDISLLPQKELSPGEKFLKWALTFGRYIIIGTEIIVLLAFVSRFKLDRDLSDLNERISQKQAVVVNFETLENNVRSLQSHLAEIKKLEEKQISYLSFFDYLLEVTPQEVIFSDLSLSPEKLSLVAFSSSNNSFALFLQNLKNSPKIKQINLQSITKSETEEKGIKFTATADLSERAFK